MIVESSAKKCSKCGETKPCGLFGSDKTRRDGLACWCKVCLSENGRKWYAANREKSINQHRRWREKNPPDRAAEMNRTRLWCAENPERARALRKNCKHKRRAKTRGKMTASELREWQRAQRKVCHWCGIKCDDYHIDHRVPLAKGGEHDKRNLVIACPPCNRSKGARCPVEFAQSLGKLV